MPKTKHCPACKRNRAVKFFAKHSRMRSGLQSYCRKCASALVSRSRKVAYAENPAKFKNYMKAWLAANPEKAQQLKVNQKLKQYGLTQAQYDQLHKTANGHCQICQQKAKLVIDHDHETGRVRGLLCRLCNMGLGKFHDSVLALQAAITYLQTR